MKKRYFILVLISSIIIAVLITSHRTNLSHQMVNSISSMCIFQNPKMSRLRGPCDPPSISSCFINDHALQKKIKAGLPDWGKEQIKTDLSKFTTISTKDLDNYFNKHRSKHNQLVRFKINNGKVMDSTNYFETNPKQILPANNKTETICKDPRISAITYVLEYLVKNNYISDTDFILGLNDYVITVDSDPVPIFTFAKDLAIPGEKDLILIPDWHNLSSLPALMPMIRKENELHPWESKKEILFWRGGSGLDSTGFRNEIVEFSKHHQDKIDAKFCDVPQYVPPEDHLNYKYLISIDGGRCSWERFIWHLHSNSLIFKHESTQVQWYYNGLKPYVHYIPVKDGNAILTQLAWAKSHESEVQQIIKNASTFVDSNLELEDLYHYIAVLLQEYTKKLNN